MKPRMYAGLGCRGPSIGVGCLIASIGYLLFAGVIAAAAKAVKR